jgi:hypothetical protein
MDSWRDGGVDSGIDLRCHETAPENLGSVLADLRFEIECVEGMKEIAGEEGVSRKHSMALGSCR